MEIYCECRENGDEEVGAGGDACLMPLERRKEEESPVGSVSEKKNCILVECHNCLDE